MTFQSGVCLGKVHLAPIAKVEGRVFENNEVVGFAFDFFFFVELFRMFM